MGLKLYRRPGLANFYVRGTVCGIQVDRSTGIPNCDLADAYRIKLENRLLDEAVFGQKYTVTFGEAAGGYSAWNPGVRFLPKLVERWRDKQLRTFNQADIDRAAADLYPGTVVETRNRQCYTPFVAVWNYAVGNGWAEKRQWRRPRKAKGTKARRPVRRSGTRPVDYERAARFVAEMSPAPAMVMTTLFYTGMRPIELFVIAHTDIDLAGRWIVLDSSKTGEPRGVPIHEFLVPMFASLLKRNDYSITPEVFRTHKRAPYPLLEGSGGQLKSAIAGARRRSGIKGISPYTGRHTVSTQLVINGVHPYKKDQILGHAADDMSRHYTNVPQKHLIEAINTLPVPDAWRRLCWWEDPLGWSRKLIKWGKAEKNKSRE